AGSGAPPETRGIVVPTGGAAPTLGFDDPLHAPMGTTAVPPETRSGIEPSPAETVAETAVKPTVQLSAPSGRTRSYARAAIIAVAVLVAAIALVLHPWRTDPQRVGGTAAGGTTGPSTTLAASIAPELLVRLNALPWARVTVWRLDDKGARTSAR